MFPRLTQTLDFQGQALRLRAERQQWVAANIANADTPGYAARDFDFAQALRDATAPSTNGALGGAIFEAGEAARGPLSPTPGYVVATQSSLDGNSVDMDRERAVFVDNALKYEATLRFVNGSVRTLLDAMKSPNT